MEKQGLLCSGKSILNCDITGYAHFVDMDNLVEEMNKCTDKIIITNAPSPDIVLLMRKASAIITATGGMTCHVAIVGREMGVPAVVAVKNIYEKVREGMKIHIIANEGKGDIYEDNII